MEYNRGFEFRFTGERSRLPRAVLFKVENERNSETKEKRVNKDSHDEVYDFYNALDKFFNTSVTW